MNFWWGNRILVGGECTGVIFPGGGGGRGEGGSKFLAHGETHSIPLPSMENPVMLCNSNYWLLNIKC